jgi:hypothetical protein
MIDCSGVNFLFAVLFQNYKLIYYRHEKSEL